jgi:hypothetical protein
MIVWRLRNLQQQLHPSYSNRFVVFWPVPILTTELLRRKMMERSGYDDHSRSRSRQGSFSSSTYSSSVDPYLDNSRHRSHSRHRSSSRHRDYDNHVPYSAAGAIPIPGTGVVVPTYGGGGGSYGHHGSYGAVPMSAHGSPTGYRGRSGGQMPIQAYQSPTTALAIPTTHSRHRSSSMSVPYAPEYPGMVGQSHAVMLEPAPRRSHKHKHHDHRDGHSHHGRARSSEPPIMYGGGYGGGYSSSARYTTLARTAIVDF